MTVRATKRIKIEEPQQGVLESSQTLLNAFVDLGMLDANEAKNCFGSFLSESPARVLLKCSQMIQDVFDRLKPILEKSPFQNDPLVSQKTYTVADFDRVTSLVKQAYEQYIHAGLKECASGDVELQPLPNTLAFPLRLRPKDQKFHLPNPVQMLVNLAKFASTRKVLFSSAENQKMMIELVHRLWEQIPEVNVTNYSSVEKAFSLLKQVYDPASLPLIELEASILKAFEEAKKELRAVAEMDLEKSVIAPDEFLNPEAASTSWVIRPKDGQKLPFATDLLLDWLQSLQGSVFFAAEDVQKLIKEAFQKAWSQDFKVNQPNWISLKHLWSRWETWSTKEFKKPPEQVFCFRFNDSSYSLSPADVDILSAISTYFNSLLKGPYRDRTVKESTFEDITLKEFETFYSAIVMRPSISPNSSLSHLDQQAAERIMILRLGCRFKCFKLVSEYFRVFIIGKTGIEGLNELLGLEKKFASNQCLDAETAECWKPQRNEHLENFVFPYLDYPSFIKFLNRNYHDAQRLGIPCFLFEQLDIPEAYCNHADFNVDVLRQALNQYGGTLKQLSLGSSKAFPILDGLETAQLTSLTLRTERTFKGAGSEQALRGLKKLGSLKKIMLCGCDDGKWISLLAELSGITEVILKFAEFPNLPAFNHLSKKSLMILIDNNSHSDVEVENFISSNDFWRGFLCFENIIIQKSNPRFFYNRKWGSCFQRMTYVKNTKKLIIQNVATNMGEVNQLRQNLERIRAEILIPFELQIT